jgi:small subunit ribosomal protein S17
MSPQAPPPAESREHLEEGRRRKLIGRVVSDKMDKTVIVEVTRFKLDAVYKKYVRARKRYKAHDEKDEYKLGDRVEILEHRPVSKTKRWKVVRLLDRPARELVEKTPEGDALP